MNNFSGIGRLGRDAVVRRTTNDKELISFALAIDHGYGANKQTIWLDCTGWGERFAKLADYMFKGDRVGVQGEIGMKEHAGKVNVTLNVREITLLGEKREEHHRPAPARSPEQRRPAPIEDDEIPF